LELDSLNNVAHFFFYKLLTVFGLIFFKYQFIVGLAALVCSTAGQSQYKPGGGSSSAAAAGGPGGSFSSPGRPGGRPGGAAGAGGGAGGPAGFGGASGASGAGGEKFRI
jgi:hypothetical protein